MWSTLKYDRDIVLFMSHPVYISSRRRVCSFYLVVKFELINVAKRPPVGYVSFVYESCDVFLVLYWMALCHSYCVFLTFSFMYRLCIDSPIFVLIFKSLVFLSFFRLVLLSWRENENWLNCIYDEFIRSIFFFLSIIRFCMYNLNLICLLFNDKNSFFRFWFLTILILFFL